MASNNNAQRAPQPGPRDYFARYHLEKVLKGRINDLRFPRDDSLRSRPLGEHDELPKPPKLQLPQRPPFGKPPKVCIIGAGAAGLFTALLFDYLNANVPNFKVTYDIWESASKEGGRLYTYEFSDSPHDYYDVGAMRFPNNPVMLRTFDLFQYLGMPLQSSPNSNPSIGSIIPYYMQGVNEPWCFNGTNFEAKTGAYTDIVTAAGSNDPFKMSGDKNNPIDPDALALAATSSPDAVLRNTIQPYIDAIKADEKNGWQVLMTVDAMSTTQFLASTPAQTPPKPPIPPFNYNTIEWLETFGGGTNWYDQAHAETILEELDFHYDDKNETNWFCVEGGAQQIAVSMKSKLASPTSITFNSKVESIDVSTQNAAKVHIAGQKMPQGPYVGVFNSTTLGCMQHMDLSQAGLTYGQKQAIRSLGYGASAKIGIKFKQPWWIETFGINKGGLGHSDLPIRTTVYPSYNLQDTGTAVLLCSYEWQQDAQRISTLISSSTDHNTAVQEETANGLVELVLRDLALLHAGRSDLPDYQTPEQVYNLIHPLYVDHYAHDWYHNPNTYGAFAFYRPQQFGSMWPYIITASPSLAIIGEHASPHHAWVVGALESAVNGVYLWLGQQTFSGASAAAKLMASWTPPTTPDGKNPFWLPFFTTPQQQDWQKIFGLLDYQTAFSKHEERQVLLEIVTQSLSKLSGTHNE